MDGQRVLTFPLSRVSDKDIKSALIWLNKHYKSDPFEYQRINHEDYGNCFEIYNESYTLIATTRRELLAYIDGMRIGMRINTWLKGDE